MAMERCSRVTLFELGHKCAQGFLLLRGAGVTRFARCVETTYIAHSNRMGVVALAVGSGLRIIASPGHRAIQVNNIMITNAAKSACTMPTVNFLNRGFATGFCGGAMNDDLIYCTHNVSKVTAHGMRIRSNFNK